VRRRKDQRVAYYNNSKSFHRSIADFATPALTDGTSSSRPDVDVHQLATPAGQSVNMEYMDDYINYQASPTGAAFDPSQQFPSRDGQPGTAWYSTSMVSYTLPIHPPNTPQSVRNGSSSPNNGPSAPIYSNELQHSPSSPNRPSGQVYRNELRFSSYPTAPGPGTYTSNAENISPSSRFGSFDSFDSMAMSVPNTVASSISETYVCPPSNSSFAPPGSANLTDLNLPGMLLANFS
jgi:hypothetical protein